jgi:hypothetical protein
MFSLNRAIHFLMSAPKSPSLFVGAKQLRIKFLRNIFHDYFVFVVIVILVLGSVIALVGLLFM